MPVGLRPVWEANLALRGVRERAAYRGNPIPEELEPGDRAYPRAEAFRTKLVETFLEHLARYGDDLQETPAESAPRIYPPAVPDVPPTLQALRMRYADNPLRFLDLPELTLEIGSHTLRCKPVRSLEALLEYITRPDARTLDRVADQLSYEDLALYHISDESGKRVGVVEVLLADIADPRPRGKAVVIEYVDLDYEAPVDPGAFLHALVDQLIRVAKARRIRFVLAPRIERLFAGRPELTGALLYEDRFRHAPILVADAYPTEVNKLRRAIRRQDQAAAQGLLERLTRFLETRPTIPAEEDVRASHQDGLAQLAQGRLPDPSLARFLAYRFRSLPDERFRVLWHDVQPKLLAALAPYHERLDAIAPYLFDAGEADWAARTRAALEAGLYPSAAQLAFIERIEQRQAFFEAEAPEPQAWQARFMDRRQEVAAWTTDEKLAYQCLELYHLKLEAEEEDVPRYPPGFFDGEEGLIHATALARYVILDARGIVDLRELTPALFYEADLTVLWERAFGRSLLAVAEALYPGQYELDTQGRLSPRALSSQEIERWFRGELELAPGRTAKRKVEVATNRVLVRIQYAQARWGQPSITLAIPGQQEKRLLDEGIADVVVATFHDPNLGLCLGSFVPVDFERWQVGDQTSAPLSVYVFSPAKQRATLVAPFIMDLHQLREGKPIQVRPKGSPWRFARTKAIVTQDTTGALTARLTFVAQAHGIKPIVLSLNDDVVRKFGIRHQEDLYVAIIKDPHHGTVTQVFRPQDFNPHDPESSANPLLTYTVIGDEKWKWASVDLAALDLIAFGEGRKDLKGLGRKLQKRVKIDKQGRGHVRVEITAGREIWKNVHFNFTKEEVGQFSLAHQPVFFEVRVDPDYGPFVAMFVDRDGQEELVGTNVWLEEKVKQRNTRVDMGRLALMDYVFSRKNMYGQLVQPRQYHHRLPVDADGVVTLQARGIAVKIFSLSNLKGKQPLFIPERNLQYGWIFKVYGLEADQDVHDVEVLLREVQSRKPDVVVVRNVARNALGPLERVEAQTITEEERQRFQQLLDELGIERLLGSLEGRFEPVLFEYLTHKAHGLFQLSRLPLLTKDWLERIRPLASGEPTPPREPASPGELQGDELPQAEPPGPPPRVTAPLVPEEAAQAEDPAVRALAKLIIKRAYQAVVQNQEATLQQLREEAEQNVNPEHRQAYAQAVAFYERIIKQLPLHSLDPTQVVSLYLYQREGIAWLLEHAQAILADDPGLGKTVQAIAAALAMRPDPGRRDLALAVVPKAAVKVWRDEIAKWTAGEPDILVLDQAGGIGRLYAAKADPRGTRMSLEAFLAHLEHSPPRPRFVLVTYEALRGNVHSVWEYLHERFPERFPEYDAFRNAYRPYEWSLPDLLDAVERAIREERPLTPEESQALRDKVIQAFGTFAAVRQLRPKALFLDEAHRLRHPETLQAQALQGLNEVPRKVLITATPLVGRKAEELWPLLNWLDPEVFPSLEQFKRSFPDTVEGRWGLYLALQEYLIRRKKADVLPELPPMTQTQVRVRLDDADQAEYDRIETEFKDWLQAEYARRGQLPPANLVFLQLLNMVEFTSGLRPGVAQRMEFQPENPKIKALDRVVEDILARGEKVVIFSRFRRVTRALKARYEATYGPDAVSYIDGQISQTKRDQEVERFQSDPTCCQVFPMTFRTGGEAITATAANNGVLYDLEWIRPEQAQNRVHRIGQTKGVNIISLVTEGTIDEDILTLHAEKEGAFKQIIEGLIPIEVQGGIPLEEQEEQVEEDFVTTLARRLGIIVLR
jgi:hypothetical protein